MKKIILLSSCLITSIAFAENVQTIFGVNSAVEHSCSVTMQDVNMGNVNLKSDTVQLGMLKYTCTKNSPFSVDLKGGNPLLNDAHVLTDGTESSDLLKYNVSSPSVPGDITKENTFPKQLVGTGESAMRWVTFLILRGQYVKPGVYSDSLIMELSY